jgi:tRNA nucleotidyltransferase (CCA-adding enzyme)
MLQSYGIFAVKEGKVLVIKQNSGNHWTLCKGLPKNGEQNYDTAVRELYEETGLRIDRRLTWCRFRQEYQTDRGLKRVDYFPAIVYGDIHIDGYEVVDYVWVKPDDVHLYLTYEEDKAVARDIVKKIKI